LSSICVVAQPLSLCGVTLNNASDYGTNGHYRTPNPNPNPNPNPSPLVR